MLTAEQLDAIRKRAKRATPGPWRVVEKGNTVKSVAVTTFAVAWNPQEMICPNMSPKTGNADFIANARTDIPALLAYIAELEQESADKERAYNEEYNLRKDIQREKKQLEQERDAAVIAIKEICNHCGFNNDPCTETGCFAHEWRGVKK